MRKRSRNIYGETRSIVRRSILIFCAVLMAATGITFVQETVSPQKAEARTCAVVGSRLINGVEYQIWDCRWIERNRTSGYGYWPKRPEWQRYEFYGAFIVREFPRFTDGLLRVIYEGTPGLPHYQYSPSTVNNFLPGRNPMRPCMYQSMDARPPGLIVRDGLPTDTINWAQYVYYNYEQVEEWQEVYLMDPATGNRIQETFPFRSKILKYPSDVPFSIADFTSCIGGGSTSTVIALCPVRVDSITIKGPRGNGLPSRSEINKFADQTKPQTIPVGGGPWPTPFASKLPSLKDPRTHSQSPGAPAAIALVQNCQDGPQARNINQKLPSPGNYDFSVKVSYVKCSYSILPGFRNNTYFGGCQQTPSVTRTHSYTAFAQCDGVLERGSNDTYDFDPADCYSPTCQWKPGDGNKVVIDNPVGATGDEAPLERKIVNPRNERAFASGVPTLWSVGLTQMRVLANAGLAAPTRIGGTKYSVFEIQKDSTPWNPRLARNERNVNHRDQYFASYSEDGSKKGVLSLLPSLTKPKDGEERVPEWEGMLLSAYNSSAVVSGSPKPFIMRIHRNEAWRLPTRVPFVASVGIFEATGGTPRVENIQQVMTCSAAPFFQSNGQCQGCVSYVSNRLIPVAR